MLRVILEFVVFLTAPAVIYVAWSMLVARRHKTMRDAIAGAPLVLLFFVGIVTVFLAMIVFRSREESNAGKAYIPPSYKDGKVVPGRIE